MEYENYQKERDKVIKKNEVYLEEFEKWLSDKGLASKTISKHIGNVDFYINDYLNYYEATEMEEGCYGISSFLGEWFIRKCTWSTASSIKTTASSIKKFYQCMAELGHIEKNSYQELALEIKENMDEWIEEVEGYNNGDDDFF